MCVCLYMHACVCLCASMCACVYVYVYVCVFLCGCVSVCRCCVCLYMCGCVYVCMLILRAGAVRRVAQTSRTARIHCLTALTMSSTYGLLECNKMQTFRSPLTVRRSVLPPSSGSKSKEITIKKKQAKS
jgi:hypothetical protein